MLKLKFGQRSWKIVPCCAPVLTNLLGEECEAFRITCRFVTLTSASTHILQTHCSGGTISNNYRGIHVGERGCQIFRVRKIDGISPDGTSGSNPDQRSAMVTPVVLSSLEWTGIFDDIWATFGDSCEELPDQH